MAITTTNKELVTLRISRKVADEVRRLATRDDESQSAILRRLLRRGLVYEQRSTQSNEAA